MEKDPVFTKVLIREVPDSLKDGITIKNLASSIDMKKANQDQADYAKIFETAGISN